MPRYIDAEKLEKDGWSASRTYQQDVKTMVYETKKMTDFPTADVVERKKGKWIRKSPTAWMWTCSCCKKDDAYAYSAGESCEPDVLQDLFCPNCGADMRGEDNADQV